MVTWEDFKTWEPGQEFLNSANRRCKVVMFSETKEQAVIENNNIVEE